MRCEPTATGLTRSVVCALLTACTLMGVAQDPGNPMATPVNDLADMSRNQLLLPGDSTAWNRLNERIDHLFVSGEGSINMVHIGGSHVQADAWTAEVRQRFQSVAPGVRAGRGYIFPYNMAGSNNPYWYEPVYTGQWSSSKNTVRADTSVLGLTGYTVTTRDSLSTLRISFRGDMYPGYTFTRATVVHGTDSCLTVRASYPDTSVVIRSFFDPQHGTTTFSFDRPVDTLFLAFERADSNQRKFTLHGILLDSDDPGFYYHAIGVNGASTGSYLRCQLFGEHLALLHPDLVVFSIGINDAHDPDFSAERFERNYEALIQRVHAVAPDAAILLVTNSDSFRKRRYPVRTAEDVRTVMMRLAARHGCAVWDLYGVMGGATSIRTWQRAGYAKRDLIHLTREGYTLIGDLMFTAMMRNYGDHAATVRRP